MVIRVEGTNLLPMDWEKRRQLQSICRLQNSYGIARDQFFSMKVVQFYRYTFCFLSWKAKISGYHLVPTELSHTNKNSNLIPSYWLITQGPKQLGLFSWLNWGYRQEQLLQFLPSIVRIFGSYASWYLILAGGVGWLSWVVKLPQWQ